jgi:phosphopantothenoylcysteine decarboxylase / phosphopantothenate---cysteine ligase
MQGDATGQPHGDIALGQRRPAFDSGGADQMHGVALAAETENLVANAVDKRQRKGCDWIVANDVSPETGIMGGDSNTVHLITADGVEHWPPQTKDEVAAALVARIAAALDARR